MSPWRPASADAARRLEWAAAGTPDPRADSLRFCLVTPSHVCNNPRLVKEADALRAAGHEVRVVAVSARRDLRARDALLLSSRTWSLDVVDVDRGGPLAARLRWVRDAVGEKLARYAFRLGARNSRIRDRAASRHLGALTQRVGTQPVDVVIGHNLAALPVAAHAASRLGAELGFDIEDLYAEVLPDDPRHERARELVREVENAYLSRCTMLTASSDGIADEVVRRYGVHRPAVILNCFPRLDPPVLRASHSEPSLYWFSQVIGRNRGIEEVVRAMPHLRARAHLHLRGEVDAEFARELRTLVATCGLEGRVHFLPPAPMDDLVRLAADHDVGLATEPGFSQNNMLAVSNKLFTYLAAGIPVVASDTPGQRDASADAPDAVFLYRRGDVAELAATLNRLLLSTAHLEAARGAARRCAEARFSWEREAPRLVAYLTTAAGNVAKGSRLAQETTVA